MEASASGSTDAKVVSSMVYTIMHSDLPPSDKTFEHVFEEVAIATGAAFETTANVLRLVLFHVYSNDEILRRLREDIGAIAVDVDNNESAPPPPLSPRSWRSCRTLPLCSWRVCA